MDKCRQITQPSLMKEVEWATYTCPIGFHALGIWPEGADGTDINSVTRCYHLHNSNLVLKLIQGQTINKQSPSLMTLARFASLSIQPSTQKHRRTSIAVIRPMSHASPSPPTIVSCCRPVAPMPLSCNGPCRRKMTDL